MTHHLISLGRASEAYSVNNTARFVCVSCSHVGNSHRNRRCLVDPSLPSRRSRLLEKPRHQPPEGETTSTLIVVLDQVDRRRLLRQFAHRTPAPVARSLLGDASSVSALNRLYVVDMANRLDAQTPRTRIVRHLRLHAARSHRKRRWKSPAR